MWPFRKRITVTGLLTIEPDYGYIIKPDEGEFWTVGLPRSKRDHLGKRVRVSGVKAGWCDLAIEDIELD